jgi:hypothetical protein
MKRLLLLFCVLILMFNLADDGRGRPGRAKFNPPNPSIETPVSPSHHAHSDRVDFWYELASAELPVSPCHADSQPVTHSVQPTFKIITYCHTGSSGGIPFKSLPLL